jgi:DNA-binding NtrC family response regulator
MSEGRVLLIDDDAAFRFAMRKALGRHGFEILEAEGGEAALAVLRSSSPPDAALLDLRMKDMGGLDVMRRLGSSETRILVLTGHGTVSAAVEAMKLGAFSFLEKPVDAVTLTPILEQAIADAKRTRRGGDPFAPPLIGESEGMREVRRFIETVGPSGETVALFGETGTGKEVAARHIHLASKRARGPFVALNCACVPKDLFESELFGHKKGSFTGADRDRLGLVREAEGGTLFIDEIGELPPELQAKLLRALETRSVRPVGESREVPFDARIVVATNRDLQREVEEGRFRRDLYYRLNVFPLVIPPLRERRDDLAELATHLLGRIEGRAARLTPTALDTLSAYDFPGNVRELLNVLRRAAVFAGDEPIDDALLSRMVRASVFGRTDSELRSSVPPAEEGDSPRTLSEVERAHIERVLELHGGNVTRAAVALGIDRRTLQRKLRSLGVRH